jgi:ELWxxDGT repeat protein
MKWTRLSWSIALLFAFTSLALAQQAVQLTDFNSSESYNNPVSQLTVFEGRIYAAGRFTDGTYPYRFAIFDSLNQVLKPLTDTDTPAIGDRIAAHRPRGTFQVIDGKLFATYYSDNTGYELFRIEGESVGRVTTLAQDPLSALVPFRGNYYFLVTGKRLGGRSGEAAPRFTTELWRTDGTAGTAEKVADLIGTTSGKVRTADNFLVAGQDALLIGGNRADGSAGIQLELYRPDGTVRVVQENGGNHDLLEAVRNRNIPAVAFAGGFYLLAAPAEGAPVAPSLIHVSGTEGKMERFADDIFPGERQPFSRAISSLVVLDGSLYVHLTNGRSGYTLRRVAQDQPKILERLAGSTQTAALVGLYAHRGKLYYGAASSTESGVMSYDPATARDTFLFSLPDQHVIDGFDLQIGADAIYAIAFAFESDILRYRPSTGVVTAIDNYYYLSEIFAGGSALRGDDLVYLGKRLGDGRTSSWRRPFVWPVGAELPERLTEANNSWVGGPDELFGTSADGSILLAGRATNHRYSRYDGERDTVVPIAAPENHPDRRPSLRGLVSGVPVFTSYDTDSGQSYYYVIQEGRFVPLTLAGSGDTLTSATSSLSFQHGLFVENYFDSLAVLALHIEGRSAEVTYLPLPSFSDFELLLFGGFTAVKTPYTGDGDSLLVLDDLGRALYTLLRPEESELISVNEEGYYLLLYPFNEAPQLIYQSADGQSRTELLFPEGVYPGLNTDVRQLGARLLFFPFSPTVGNEFYVADPTAGSIELLLDINPGPGRGPLNTGVRAGERLYFAADDGSSGMELWRTDGTTDGTRRVADLNDGSRSGAPHSFYASEDHLWFTATGAAGSEVYRMTLDGSESVSRVADINPGPGSSDPGQYLLVDDHLYFLARPARESAVQLFRLDAPITGINRSPRAISLGVFPNPATHWLRVSYPEQQQIETLAVWDQLGRRVRHYSGLAVVDNRIDVSQLPPGTYTLTVRFTDGRQGVGRVIVR